MAPYAIVWVRFGLLEEENIVRTVCIEGREGVKWELGFALFRGWEMGFCALGLGFMKEKTIEKWEWDFNLSNTGWDCGI